MATARVATTLHVRTRSRRRRVVATLAVAMLSREFRALLTDSAKTVILAAERRRDAKRGNWNANLMSQKPKLRITAIPQTTLRRLRNIPTYFFLIWRWTWWFYALAWIALDPRYPYLFLLLGITLIQALIVTLYAPVFKLLLPGVSTKSASGAKVRKTSPGKALRRPRWRLRTLPPITADEELEVLPPIAR